MTLNTDHLKRCIQTLRSSLTFFEQAAPESIDQEIYRNAIVKGYELAQETSFKLLKKALRDYGHSAKKLPERGGALFARPQATENEAESDNR